MAVFKTEDVSIADGRAKDIGGQVLQSGLAGANRDDIHDPVLAPDLQWDKIEEPGLFEQVSELGPKDAGEGFFREEVVVVGRSPCVAVRCEPAPGDQVVHVGVVAKVSGPGLQEADHAEGASDVFGIGSELLQCLL